MSDEKQGGNGWFGYLLTVGFLHWCFPALGLWNLLVISLFASSLLVPLFVLALVGIVVLFANATVAVRDAKRNRQIAQRKARERKEAPRLAAIAELNDFLTLLRDAELERLEQQEANQQAAPTQLTLPLAG